MFLIEVLEVSCHHLEMNFTIPSTPVACQVMYRSNFSLVIPFICSQIDDFLPETKSTSDAVGTTTKQYSYRFPVTESFAASGLECHVNFTTDRLAKIWISQEVDRFVWKSTLNISGKTKTTIIRDAKFLTHHNRI